MAVELYNDGDHFCVGYYDLVSGRGGVQANQFLIADHHHAALIDPGGPLVYDRLFMQVNSRVFTRRELDFIIASHQDPDVISSLNKWLVGSSAKIVVPELWARFIPHFAAPGRTDGRLITVPDRGMNLPFGESHIKCIPAHFLHSEGNFQFYDPVSRILFSGDVGASTGEANLERPVEDFEAHLPTMEPFHRRYMAGNRVCRLWANMVRGLDVEWIVPQHGRSFRGKPMVERFLDWFENLACGIDLVDQSHYQVP